MTPLILASELAWGDAEVVAAGDERTDPGGTAAGGAGGITSGVEFAPSAMLPLCRMSEEEQQVFPQKYCTSRQRKTSLSPGVSFRIASA